VPDAAPPWSRPIGVAVPTKTSTAWRIAGEQSRTIAARAATAPAAGIGASASNIKSSRFAACSLRSSPMVSTMLVASKPSVFLSA